MLDRSRIVSGLAAEVAFAVLPLLVVLMVAIHLHGPSLHLFASPEWSFGASILFGQALVKFVSGISHGGEAAEGPVALVIALIIVFGLAPSLFALTVTLQAWEAQGSPAGWVQIFQVILFVGASAVYMLLGVIGASWSGRNPTR